MDQHYDLVIIGAGPAGAAAAVTGRKLGLSVALIDKARFPRAKLCGGLVTGRCAKHLRDVFGIGTVAALFDRNGTFEFYMDGRRLARMENVPPAWLTMRWDFDHLLLDKARAAGAADFTGRRVERLDLAGSAVNLQSGERLVYGVLIGADGVQSAVAKAVFGRSFDARKIGFALEIEDTEARADAAAPIRIDFAAAAWGYGWRFPKRAGATIGLGGLHAQNPDIKARLAAYLDRLGAGKAARVKGHFLPFGDARARPGRGNVLLAGDAAGFVDPITGEGIGYAIQSGALAARAAAEALAAGRPQTALRLYRPATAPIRRAVRTARIMRPVIFARPLKPFFANTFAASRSLKHEYMHLLAGESEYPGLLRRMARRLPGAGLRWLMGAGRNTRAGKAMR